MRDWGHGHMDSGWGIVMMLGMVGVWALVAIAIVWLVRATGTSGAARAAHPTSSSTAASAERTLADRLAHGEIDIDEYQSRIDALASRRPGPTESDGG
jgi:putative membrane protein